MREIDRLTSEQYATPSLLLMESAAGAALRTISGKFDDKLAGKKARILCGPGNNGGDGAALARQLADVGVHVDLVLFGRLENTKGDARTNFEAVKHLASFAAGSTSLPSPITFVECENVSSWEGLARPVHSYDILVDALFGTGLSRPLEDVYPQVIEHLALLRRARDRAGSHTPVIVSLDVPSGVNADLEQLIGPTVTADVTITFTAPKPANVLPPACYSGGELVIADIGSPAALVDAAVSKLFFVEPDEARNWLVRTRYQQDSHKNMHGHVLIVAGSPDYSGAAVLCGNAAMRSGAGLVTIATGASAQAAVAARVMPEVMTTALPETDRGSVSEAAVDHVLRLGSKASVLAIGPGLTSADERTRRFVLEVVNGSTKPVVIDADGLNCLAPWPEALRGSTEAPLIITPHPGEMLRLIGAGDKSVLDDRVAVARQFAVQHNVTVLLKGGRSLIAAPDGRVFINSTGNPGLGTAGAGDTLTGLIAGFIAQSAGDDTNDLLQAVIAALYVGGLAGDLAAKQLGMRTMVASDIREHFGEAIRSLDEAGEVPLRS
jgi:ADP-dependent NAD(P)H-hydrate dehydratase / NAD(P)H-hydrate epimerase